MTCTLLVASILFSYTIAREITHLKYLWGPRKTRRFALFPLNFNSSILCHMPTCPIEDNPTHCLSNPSISLYPFSHAEHKITSPLKLLKLLRVENIVVSASEDTQDDLSRTWVLVILKPLCFYLSVSYFFGWSRNWSTFLFSVIPFCVYINSYDGLQGW